MPSPPLQGGFAHCYELIDCDDQTVYAGKIVPKASLTKPHQRDKASHHHSLTLLHICHALLPHPPPSPLSDGNGD